jgi:hypothetical protein
LFVGLVLTIIAPVAASAQNWSAEEQAVLKTIEIRWDAWLEAVEGDNPDVWTTKCPSANYSMWWTGQGAPVGPEGDIRTFPFFKDLNERWADIRPVAIRIVDNTALVQFYG